MSDFRSEIPEVQKWNGRTLDFDADASPLAWEHFSRYYSVSNWELLKDYDLDNLSFFIYNEDSRLYKNASKGKGNALFVLPYNCKEVVVKGKKGFRACQRLRGETDFNFNAKKVAYFKKFLDVDSGSRLEDLALLDFCKSMHHALVNFSLMPSCGNLQGFKGSYEKQDRLDSFVWSLNNYYTFPGNKFNTAVIENASFYNKQTLVEYLDSFNDIYDYCKKIYFIEDTIFVDKLISNGTSLFRSSSDVVKYLQLAIEFWDMKEDYFNKQ